MKIFESIRNLGWKGKAGIVLLCAFLGVVFVLICLPLWFGGAVKAFAPEGVEIGKIERLSWSRFEMKEVSARQAGVNAEIDSVEAYYPLSWLLSGAGDDHGEPFVKLGKVKAVLESVESSEEKENEELSVPELLDTVTDLVDDLADWILPHAVMEEAMVEASGQRVTIKDLVWSDRRLEVEVVANEKLETLSEVSIHFPKDGDEQIELEVANASFESRLGLRVEVDGDEALVEGEGFFKQNKASFNAEWGADEPLPTEASWQAMNWELSSSELGIPIEDTLLQFSVDGSWSDSGYENRINGEAMREGSRLLLEPISFSSEIEGGLESIIIKTLEVSGSGIEVGMSEEVEYDFADNRIEGEGVFEMAVDLGAMGISGAEGELRGELFVGANDLQKPKGRADLSWESIKVEEYDFERLAMKLSYDWPVLTIEEGRLVWKDDYEAMVTGSVDVEKERLEDVEVSANLDEESLRPFLEEGMTIAGLSVSASADGVWSDPAHSGSISIEKMDTPELHPIDALVGWKGTGADVDQLEGQLETGEASFAWSGAVSSDGRTHGISFEKLDLAVGEDEGLSLTRPSRFSVTLPEGEDGPLDFSADFEIADDKTSISVTGEAAYPEAVTLNLGMTDFVSGKWIQPWLKAELPELLVKEVDFKYELADSDEVEFSANYDAALNWEGSEYAFTGGAVSDGERVGLQGVSVKMNGSDVLVVEGDFPSPLDMTDFQLIPLDANQEFEVSVRTENSPLLSATLSEWSEYEFSNLGLSMELKGPFADPKGSFNALANVRLGDDDESGIVELVLNASVDGEEIALDEMVASLGSEKFLANGSLALPEDAYSALFEGAYGKVDWSDLRFDMELPESELSPIARFIPQLIAPGGKIAAKISGSGLSDLEGYVNVDSLNTRALFPFGALRDIKTELNFKGQRLELGKFSGGIGREFIDMTGYADIVDRKWRFGIRSDNTPLLRQSGMLLRATKDLEIVGDWENGTDVSGTIQLDEGLFALDLSALTAGGGASGRSAESRPPYFSVDVEPLDDWRLNIAVKGEAFKRVETPAVVGILSTDMVLGGRLGEPLLRGRTFFEEGTLVFPFANFEIDHGEVVFPIDDPYSPKIQMLGRSRRFGYDLGVEISGDAFDPLVRFSSSPALTSEQILLMVMAGENPEGVVKYSASQRASKLGSFFSKGLLSSGGSGGGLGSRLSISSGENLSEQGKETLEVEVLISERVQLLGEYDEYDAWNAGVRWRVLREDAFERRKLRKEAKAMAGKQKKEDSGGE
ncbi:MAG: translocation/assembly module TamB domain-containing protein [Verrucomicrobiota bacterium]